MKPDSNTNIHVGNTIIAIVGAISIIFMVINMYSGSIDRAGIWSFIAVMSWCVYFGRSSGWDNSEIKVRVEVEAKSEDLWMEHYQDHCRDNGIHYDHPNCPCAECCRTRIKAVQNQERNLLEEEHASKKVIIS